MQDVGVECHYSTGALEVMVASGPVEVILSATFRPPPTVALVGCAEEAVAFDDLSALALTIVIQWGILNEQSRLLLTILIFDDRGDLCQKVF